MQLQENLDKFEQAGISVFAISYDSVEAQADFAEKFGITYSLLSDVNSDAIEATGILNVQAVPEKSVGPGLAASEQTILKVTPFNTEKVEANLGSSFYGIPYPGSYLIGTDGRVIEKLFYRHYRTRPSAETVLRSGFGVDFEVHDNPSAESSGKGVNIRATLGSKSMTYMEASLLYVEIDLADGLHLYGSPVPDGYIATTVTVTGPESVEVGPARYPETRPFEVTGLDESFQVFDGALEIAVPVYYVQEDFEHLLRRSHFLASDLEEPSAGVVRQLIAHAEATRPPPDTSVELDVSVKYQACTTDACLIPQEQSFKMDIPIVRVQVNDSTKPKD